MTIPLNDPCGKDLNRDWDKPADPRLAPENYWLDQWLHRMIAARQTPDLAPEWRAWLWWTSVTG
jgi:hypothetical protein